MYSEEFLRKIKHLDQLIQQDLYDDAKVACTELSASSQLSISELLLLSRVWQRLGDFKAMRTAAQKARELDSEHPDAVLREIESDIYCGDIQHARSSLALLENRAGTNTQLLQEIAQLYLHCSAHTEAGRCYAKAVELKPDHAPYLFNLASSLVTLGEIKRAEQLFNQLIEQSPLDYGALLNRSMLKTWKPENHHLHQLSDSLSALAPGDAGEVPLCYALAKEYEDLGEFKKSFSFLRRGADRRRSMLAYKVEQDIDAMRQIRETFNQELFAKTSLQAQGAPAYFVFGLPRTGTTLVDRILSSHSQVGSLGEISNLAYAIMQLASGPGGKREMIKRSATINMADLGQIYSQGIQGFGATAAHLINKTPQNFLYAGLIHLALPEAKMIHLRRHPLDSCYAMYKTLFRMGYPFSYNLEDLGHYYLAYHQLMQHWRDVLPGKILDIDYETLVDQQERTSRELLAFCGLTWEDACLEFQNNTAPAATASAAQVRQPVYRSSLQRWKDYAEELAPLALFLEKNGIDCS